MEIDKSKVISLALIMIGGAFAHNLFHEFGHWTVGTLLGNDMGMNLNLTWPTNGGYIDESHSVYVAIGGPAFSIIFAAFALVFIVKYRTIYAYPILIFPLIARAFSLIFGKFHEQDEAGISASFGLGKYTVAIIVCLTLFLLVWKGSSILKLRALVINNFVTCGIIAKLLVIATIRIL